MGGESQSISNSRDGDEFEKYLLFINLNKKIFFILFTSVSFWKELEMKRFLLEIPI